jgi:hypothetical protein
MAAKRNERQAVYRVFKELENGEFQHVAFRDELEQAVGLVERLNIDWPGNYVVKDTEGNSFAFRRKSLVM